MLAVFFFESMSDWKKCKLGDIIELQRGYDLPHAKRCPGDYPIVSSSGITGTHSVYKVNPPGVVTGRYGTIGEVFYTKACFWPLNTTLFVSDFKGNFPRFVYYLLQLFDFQRFCEKSTVPGINRNDLYPTVIRIPLSIKKQKLIAQVLSSLDEKIDLNRQLNDNLEAMAQALYDYWFVQFDFPDENGKPYKSSGGKMAWNEQLKREIPEGWEVKQIREVADTCLGGTPVTNIREYWDGGNIPWISSGDLTSNPLLQVSDYITQKGLNNSAAKLMPKGTVVVSLVRYIRPSILGIDAAGNQSVVGIFANKILPTCFLYPYVKSEVPRLMGLRTGAQQPHINKEVIDSSFIVLPDNVSIMGQYQNKALGIYEKLLCVAKERESLTKQRDFLLPLLMNGQVQVKPLNYRLDYGGTIGLQRHNPPPQGSFLDVLRGFAGRVTSVLFPGR